MKGRFDPYRHGWVLVALLQLIATYAMYQRFSFDLPEHRVWATSDDVYISADYARSLVSGDGLVWYHGAPRVEGFSNPLWVALIAMLHALPGFSEHRLGLFLLLLDVPITLATWWQLWKALQRSIGERPSPDRWALALVVVLGAFQLSLPYWLSEGFEVGLVALLAFAAFAIALRDTPEDAHPSRHAVLIGALIGLAFWTRMDAVVAFTGTLLLIAQRPRRRVMDLFIVLTVASLFAGALLLARHAYYGDWLPNTYYLKLKGWPLRDRLRRGVFQARYLLPIAIGVWLPFLSARFRRLVHRPWSPMTASLATFTASTAYTIHNGGDVWGTFWGYDRFTLVGGLFLFLAFAIFILDLEPTRRSRIIAYAAIVAITLWIGHNPLSEWRKRLHPRTNELEWIQYGIAFADVSKPDATIAICPAGAIVYFSHRGALDLLGKSDRYIAKLDVLPDPGPSKMCWQSQPGHNKEDPITMFRVHEPDFSRYEPPKEMEARYMVFSYRGYAFWVRRDSNQAEWSAIP